MFDIAEQWGVHLFRQGTIVQKGIAKLQLLTLFPHSVHVGVKNLVFVRVGRLEFLLEKIEIVFAFRCVKATATFRFHCGSFGIHALLGRFLVLNGLGGLLELIVGGLANGYLVEFIDNCHVVTGVFCIYLG